MLPYHVTTLFLLLQVAVREQWAMLDAFTSSFKELDPIPQYKATAKLAGFLQSVRTS